MKFDDENADERAAIYKVYGIYGGAGFQLVAAVLLGVYLGRKVDEALDTKPLFLLLGLALGFVVGFWGLFRLVRNKNKEPHDDTPA